MTAIQSNLTLTSPARRKHAFVWSKIINTPLPDVWMLVGPRLPVLYHEDDCGDGLIYLALVCLAWKGDLQYDYSLAALRATLLPHTYDEETSEARLIDSNIVINIWSWAKQDDATAVSNMYSTLLSSSRDAMLTYLLLKDNGSMHTGAWELRMAEHQDSCTVMTEEQQFLECIASMAGRPRGRIDILSPVGRTWCFFEWDGRRSIDGLGKYNWLVDAWREHEAFVKYGKRNV